MEEPLLGEPRMGGREGGGRVVQGGVNLPDRRSGEEVGEVRPGETVQGEAVAEGEAVQCWGGVPAQEEEEPEEVRRRWGAGGVPMVNWTWGGSREAMLGPIGTEGADTRRDLLVGNC